MENTIIRGLTENISQENYRWSIIDNILSPLKLSNFMGLYFDDQDVLSKYIEIYHLDLTYLMIDH